MFQFAGFPPPCLCVRHGVAGVFPAGSPHSDTCGSLDICSSPQLFAACRVFRRPPVPRHPPCALFCLASRRIALRRSSARPARLAAHRARPVPVLFFLKVLVFSNSLLCMEFSRCTAPRPGRHPFPFLLPPGGHLLSHAVPGIVSSAARGLTAVFGMCTGVPRRRIATRSVLPQRAGMPPAIGRTTAE